MAVDLFRGIFAAVLAAILFAAFPVHAQQKPATLAAPRISGPNPGGACPDNTSSQIDANGSRSCPPDGGRRPTAGILAVVLPDLLVDLFPIPDGGIGRRVPDDNAGDSLNGPIGRRVPDAPEGNDGSGDGGGVGGRAGGGVAVPTPNPRTVDRGDRDAGTARPATSGQAPGPGGALSAPSPNATNVAPPPVAPRAIAGAFVPDEVLATVAGDAAQVQDIASQYNLQIRSQRISELLGATIVRFGIADGRPVALVLAQLETDARTLMRAPNHIYQLQQAATIPNYAFGRIALDEANASGDNVRVAVVDTAVDQTLPALAGVIAESHDAMPDTPMADRSHGTSVIGLIAGVGSFRGMAPGAKIYHARAFEGGKSTMDIILDALDWAASRDVRIINMSFVGPKNDLLELACAAARVRGMVLVAAAGNNGPKAPYAYPAAYDDVIAVTATDEKDQLMKQANRGAYVYVAAPGVDMLAPTPGGVDLVTGTSFASAIVSGVIADLLHVRPDASATWIEETLAATASDLGATGRDNEFGFGLINYRSLAAAR